MAFPCSVALPLPLFWHTFPRALAWGFASFYSWSCCTPLLPARVLNPGPAQCHTTTPAPRAHPSPMHRHPVLALGWRAARLAGAVSMQWPHDHDIVAAVLQPAAVQPQTRSSNSPGSTDVSTLLIATQVFFGGWRLRCCGFVVQAVCCYVSPNGQTCTSAATGDPCRSTAWYTRAGRPDARRLSRSCVAAVLPAPQRPPPASPSLPSGALCYATQFSLHLIAQYMHVCMPRVKNLLGKKHPHVAGQHTVRGGGGGGRCGGDADVHSSRIQWRPIVAAWQLVDVSQTVAALL